MKHLMCLKMQSMNVMKYIKSNLDHSIKDILWSETIDKNLIHQTKYTQPALFVVEYALSKLWMSVGVQPTALIGHSIGEIGCLNDCKCY
jgi:acyl transferase domain-containing protein